MKYTDSHEWIQVKDNRGIVGISHYAKEELGEIVYIEFPKIGTEIKAGEEIAVLESTKAAADIYSPVTGKVVAVNQALQENISVINSSPEDEGWIYEIELREPKELEILFTRESYLKECVKA